jgi:ABC-2 type transport system permease protein
MYVLAAHITGTPRTDDAGALDETKPADEKKADEKKGDEKKADESADKAKEQEQAADKKPGLNVIIVADVDMLHSEFFDLRARRMPDNPYQFESDNVPFVLNVLDVLAGDERFVELRNRRPYHRPLDEITERTAGARAEAEETRREFEADRDKELTKLENDYKNAEASLKAEIANLQKEGTVSPAMLQQKVIEMQAKLSVDEARKNRRIEELRKKAQNKVEEATIKLNNAVRSVQDKYKLGSVLLPPLLPLAVAFFVYFNRRAKEREGVSKARLR